MSNTPSFLRQMFRRLELEFNASDQLHDARTVSGRCDPHEARRVDVLRLPEEEVGVVKNVERLSAELKSQVLFDADVLDEHPSWQTAGR
jgi:hypothetical protein